MEGNIILLKNKTQPVDEYDILFKKKNLNPIFIPLLKHSHYDRRSTSDYLMSQEFLEVPVFIITSHRAVEVFNDCLSEVDRHSRERILDKIGYTVGPVTSKALEKLGFKDVRGGSEAGNGSVLADIILKEVPKDQEIVFFTGEVRKDIIPKKLKNNNYNLKEKIIYKTESRKDIISNFNSAIDGIKNINSKNNWIVFFSPQGTELIVDYIRQSDNSFQIASIGPTTHEYLVNNSITPLVTSKKPHATALHEGMIEKSLY